MTRKTLATIGILIVLLVGTFGAVAAQTPPSNPDGQETESKFLNHPVVQILSAYFSRNSNTDTDSEDTKCDPTTDSTCETEPACDPAKDPTCVTDDDKPAPKLPADILAEEIAGLHEDGMGFGVLVKLYALAGELKEDCEPVEGTTVQGANEPGSDDFDACTATPTEIVKNLSETMKGEGGMGALIKQYKALLDEGDTRLLGVGHVKKDSKNSEITDDSGTTLTTTDTQGNSNKDNKGNKLPKDNRPNRGPKK